MSEEQWLASDPIAMMDYLTQDVISPRKLRLFSCACCRRIWDKLIREESRCAIRVGELVADNKIPKSQLQTNREALAKPGELGFLLEDQVTINCLFPDGFYQYIPLIEVITYSYLSIASGYKEYVMLSIARIKEIIRDIFGNPFRDYPDVSKYLGKDVVTLAQACYESTNDLGEIDNSCLLALSDALEEARCGSEVILNHLRNREKCPVCKGKTGWEYYPKDDPTNSRLEGPHWHSCDACEGQGLLDTKTHSKGCWVIDSILEKV